MRVLIVEDKVKMAGQLWRALRGEGMTADVAVKGEDALWMAGVTAYDALVLDVMLPGIDGFETVRRLRADGRQVPILMLTARGSLEDRVTGLDGGADDYLTKPFELAELVARLHALVRRGPVARATVLEVGTLRLDPAGRRVWRGGQEIELAEKPFALLETFMRRPGVRAGRATANGIPTILATGVNAGAHTFPLMAETHAGSVPAVVTAQALDILVCDDESSLREALRQSFQREGHRVVAVSDGRAAIDRASTQHFDVVLLDIALGPGSPDGYEVCRELRARRNAVAVIMLTALDSEADAVVGLEAGADDYIVKPFRPAELRSRIRAVLRRTGVGDRRDGAPLTAGPLALDPALREVHVAGRPIDLTFSEFELLHALMAQRHRVHSRHDLLRAIWGDSAYRDPRSIDVHVRHLREKLEARPEEPRLIVTVRGAGYRLGEP